mmetsp:Transcript_53985/g.99350  ORF Transcript_53985/g.99350 Transcript_53985/m.99350 type:complete len:228 (+) Transcript_53985:452-1135(+)
MGRAHHQGCPGAWARARACSFQRLEKAAPRLPWLVAAPYTPSTPHDGTSHASCISSAWVKPMRNCLQGIRRRWRLQWLRLSRHLRDPCFRRSQRRRQHPRERPSRRLRRLVRKRCSGGDRALLLQSGKAHSHLQSGSRTVWSTGCLSGNQCSWKVPCGSKSTSQLSRRTGYHWKWRTSIVHSCTWSMILSRRRCQKGGAADKTWREYFRPARPCKQIACTTNLGKRA